MTTLERDLGLFATLTISIGAMIGSGIFVLPGLAAEKAGPAVVLAYLLAGLLVVPAALSKAEMATAMPEAGGTYLFIDRAIGPLPGTIAGIGAWFSLVFKSAFALVGLGAYLLVLVSLPDAATTLVALALAVVLVGVNLVGVEQTGRLQAGIVTLVLLALVAFVADGLTLVEQARYHPFFEAGPDGLLAATGFVFVSYAGVTKIASVAEEVENPDRNIPLGILLSVGVMMLVYTLVVFVVVGVVPLSELGTGLTPMTTAAEAVVPGGGVVAAAVAVLALTSMANAGVLSSSRYPLAMSRDNLAPAWLSTIHDRFHTPLYALALTGAGLLALVVFVPVDDLAKLASAFQILVFTFINVALVAFRESRLSEYDPAFVAPGYPWVQLAGIGGGLVLLPTMGLVPLAGAVGIVLVGVGWYRVYGRERTDREGAALDALRRSAGDRVVERTRTALPATDGGAAVGASVLVAVGSEASERRLRTLVEVASRLAAPGDGEVTVLRVESVPEQTDLAAAVDADSTTAERLRGRVENAEPDVPVRTETAVAHDPPRAVVNYAAEVGADQLIGSWTDIPLAGRRDWVMAHAPCDVTFVRDRGFGDVSEVVVLANRGLYAPQKVATADALASATGAHVRFVTAVGPDASPELRAAARSFHAELGTVCTVETSGEVVTGADRVAALVTAAADADVAVVGLPRHGRVHDLLRGDVAADIADRVPCTALLVHTRETVTGSVLGDALQRAAF
ncbi:MAG: amino acid permease [Haloglomus sp.]